MFLVLLCIPVLILLITLAAIYFKLIRPGRRIYDIFRAQRINCEPFVPLFGQIYDFHRYQQADMRIAYHDDLIRKHGNVYLFSVGPAVHLVINEPDMLADVLRRNNAQNYVKPQIITNMLKPLIGKHNLLITEDNEHERGRRMLNPAFYHANLKLMISIIVDRTIKCIDSLSNKSNFHQKSQQQVDLQILFNRLTLSVIVSCAFGSDFEINAYAKHVMCRVFNEMFDAIMYRGLRMIYQIPFLSKLPFWKKDVVDN
ncbi:unnamed protein product [Rotaria sordida]|uniref:Cytochrome P450 n=1 Tax=Rotaria sordida TaxID=392033 RepID=A0A814TAX8_9BILA|nr:unnamed protein product [Rotaria sordida]